MPLTPWTANDRVALRQYLGANPKFLQELELRKPRITGTTLEERGLTGSDRNGYDLMKDVINELSSDEVPQPKPQSFIS